jgi:hypothetical protein
MSTILDLPNEIHIIIARYLRTRSLNSLLQTCRSLYASYLPHLWSTCTPKNYSRKTIIPLPHILVHASQHHIDSLVYHATLTEEFYNIVYHGLQTLQMGILYEDPREVNFMVVKPVPVKVLFLRNHPFVRKFVYHHKDVLPKEFWEVVAEEWKGLEVLTFSGLVDRNQGAVGAFWKACARVRELSILGYVFAVAAEIAARRRDEPTEGEDVINMHRSILSMLEFRDLCQLKVTRRQRWGSSEDPQKWPLLLLEQIKKTSKKLKRFEWDHIFADSPVRTVLEALEEECWPELCEICSGNAPCSDKDMSRILRALLTTVSPSLSQRRRKRRLTHFEHSTSGFGWLTYICLKELYFRNLQDLDIGRCSAVTSTMVLEILTGCPHLISLVAPYVFIRDVAKAQKSWVCLGLEKLVLYFAKQEGDEPAWESVVFGKIASLRRLLKLYLERDPHFSFFSDEPRSDDIMDLRTLDFRFPSTTTTTTTATKSSSSKLEDSCNNDGGGRVGEGGADIRCWSSLVQLKHFTFDHDREELGLDELEWMIKTWSDLEWVSGAFTGIVRENTTTGRKDGLDGNGDEGGDEDDECVSHRQRQDWVWRQAELRGLNIDYPDTKW